MNRYPPCKTKRCGVHGYDPEPAIDNLCYALFGRDFSDTDQKLSSSENTHKEAKEMANQEAKVKAPFSADIDGHRYSVERCVKLVAKDGTTYYRPVSKDDIVLCFVRDGKHAVAPVSFDGGPWKKQLYTQLAQEINVKKQK